MRTAAEENKLAMLRRQLPELVVLVDELASPIVILSYRSIDQKHLSSVDNHSIPTQRAIACLTSPVSERDPARTGS